MCIVFCLLILPLKQVSVSIASVFWKLATLVHMYMYSSLKKNLFVLVSYVLGLFLGQSTPFMKRPSKSSIPAQMPTLQLPTRQHNTEKRQRRIIKGVKEESGIEYVEGVCF